MLRIHCTRHAWELRQLLGHSVEGSGEGGRGRSHGEWARAFFARVSAFPLRTKMKITQETQGQTCGTMLAGEAGRWPFTCQ